MQALFTTEFSYNQQTGIFTIYQVSDNLFQARSSSEIIMLWKTGETWEGVTNTDEPVFVQSIGLAIDNHFATTKKI